MDERQIPKLQQSMNALTFWKKGPKINLALWLMKISPSTLSAEIPSLKMDLR